MTHICNSWVFWLLYKQTLTKFICSLSSILYKPLSLEDNFFRSRITSGSGGPSQRVTVPEGSFSPLVARLLLCFTGMSISRFVLLITLSLDTRRCRLCCREAPISA